MIKQPLTNSGYQNLSADNPLSEIINIIPWITSVLDIELLDAIRSIIIKCNPGTFYTDRYILLLLDQLMQGGYIYLHQINSKDVPGTTILITRI